MRETLPLLEQIPFPPIRRGRLDTLQLNVGYRCNQSCVHCHVDASPHRTEEMGADVADVALAFLERRKIATLDITGGAPELNPQFRRLVTERPRARRPRHGSLQPHDPGGAGPGRPRAFLARRAGRGGRVDALLSRGQCRPPARQGRVRKIDPRACSSSTRSATAATDRALALNLVYNPQGPSLPPPQEALEADYKRELGRYGIVFNHLFTLANMPIKRFGSMLAIKGEFDRYLGVLRDAHADANLDHVMCRNLISVDWRGFVYDCDFNQMLDLPLAYGGRPRVHLSDLLDADLAGNPIRVAGHCYGCTAGQGSSCGGALAAAE